MKQLIKNSLKGLLLVPALVLGFSLMVPVAASAADASCDDLTISGGAACAKGEGVASDLFGEAGIFSTIVNILLFIVGAIAVIMLIIGGIRYVVSGGDQSAVTAAKNTILYAIVGIIVAFLAYAAVGFVTEQLANSGS